MPPPPSAAQRQHSTPAASGNPARQRPGAKAPGTTNDAQPDATAGPPKRPAWGAKPVLADQPAAQQRSSDQATLAHDAADFVPASSAWHADGGEWHGEDADADYPEDAHYAWLQHGGYSQHTDEEGYYHESEQEWYQAGDGGSGQLGGWDAPVTQQGQQQGEGGPGADAEEALQQQLGSLQVDEPSGHDERSEWLLMCEVRTPVLSGPCPPDSTSDQRETIHTPAKRTEQQGPLVAT